MRFSPSEAALQPHSSLAGMPYKDYPRQANKPVTAPSRLTLREAGYYAHFVPPCLWRADRQDREERHHQSPADQQ